MAPKVSAVIEQQKQYVESLTKKKFKYGITVGTTFVKGIREIGYKHTAAAVNEEIDNSDEGGAENVHVVLNDDGTGRKNNVTQIAVIDDGVGMIPEMIRLAVLWGGTHRFNSRSGFGRFGYGLPSSCVSQGRRFEVYSAPEGGTLHMAAFDLDEIESGAYSTEGGDIVVPPAKPAKLPRFVQAYIEQNLPGWSRGTVVVMDKLDKLTWKSMNTLQNNLFEHLGVDYHKLRHKFELFLNGKRVEPIDPLFLTSGYRWFDVDADRAVALDPARIDVKNKETGEVIGRISVRYSYMSPRFASIDKSRAADKKNQNPRFNILKEYNGFIICRMGRVIDVVRHSPIWTFQNNDRYMKVELDFDASLDEEFNVSTSKQRVDISERIWEILESAGVDKALSQMRKKYDEARASLASDDEKKKDGKRPSEKAMEETAKMAPVVPLPLAERRAEAGRKRLEQEAKKRAQDTGKTVDQAKAEIEAELGGKVYKVAKRSVPGGAFFEVEQIGGTKVLWLNTASKFFQQVHSGPHSTPAVRAALEILLFAIGDRILEGQESLKATYAHEIPQWSQKLEFALAHLGETLEGADQDDDAIEARGGEAGTTGEAAAAA